MRPLINILLAVSLIFLTAAEPLKEVKYKILVNKSEISSSMIALFESSVTMLPAEVIFEAHHYKVKKQEKSKLIIVTDGYTKLEITIGSTTAYIKGMNQYTKQSYGDGVKVILPVAPHLYDKNIYLPISFIAQSLALHYQINKKENIIIFSSIPKKTEAILV